MSSKLMQLLEEMTLPERAAVEHRFGPIKPCHDQGYFLMQGPAKVQAECSVSTLAYHLRRVMTLLGGAPCGKGSHTWRSVHPIRMALACWATTLSTAAYTVTEHRLCPTVFSDRGLA